jgi:hypothetical protein
VLFDGSAINTGNQVIDGMVCVGGICPQGIIREVQVDWDLIYGHADAGYVPWQSGATRLLFEVGVAYSLYSRLSIGAADQNAYGNPKRVIFKEDRSAGSANFGAGKGDFGGYAALALDFSAN